MNKTQGWIICFLLSALVLIGFINTTGQGVISRQVSDLSYTVWQRTSEAANFKQLGGDYIVVEVYSQQQGLAVVRLIDSEDKPNFLVCGVPDSLLIPGIKFSKGNDIGFSYSLL